MQTKREFLKSMALAAALPFTARAKTVVDSFSPLVESEGSEYWKQIRSQYLLKPDYINLENGYFSIMAQPVLEGYLNDVRVINKEGSYYMRTVQFENKRKVKERLAEMIGCESEELIITRNTTESLDTIISGIDWKPIDEAVMAEQDYGSMLDMFKQQARRYGIVNKIISLPLHPEDDEEIVSLYEKAISPKTRLLMICHMVNITGQILPVKKICDMAHAKGVEVMVDGAHAFAHFEFKVQELGCDYYGTSLHKWLGAPMGAGLLFVKRDKIQALWPIYGDSGFTDDNVSKLNHTGTHPVSIDIAIHHAIDYHNGIGIRRKENRLRYLQNYWTLQAIEIKGVSVNTPIDSSRSCAIANVGVKNTSPAILAKRLLDEHKIWTVAIDSSNVHGVRITPHIYTRRMELDRLIKALEIISMG